ncbi:MAG: c-type cytochrome [Nitrospiria bacterium]
MPLKPGAFIKASEGTMLAINKRRTESSHFGPCLTLVLLVLMFSSVSAQISTSLESPWKGREVFRQKGCNQCHAVYGENGNGGPDLGKQKFYGTYLELAALMWNHFPSMSQKMRQTGYQFTELNSEEMSQLISYLAYFRYLGEPGIEFSGRKLLKSKGCVTCHKFGGVGGDVGPDISAIEDYMAPIKLAEALWNHGPNLLEIFEKHKVKRPEFEDDEIVNLAAGIRSFMSPRRDHPGDFAFGDPVVGYRIAEKKGCMKCHAASADGNNLGPDFTELDLNYSVTQIAGKMWNHGPQMWEVMKRESIAFPVFEKGEIADVIAYIYGLKLKDPPGDTKEGYKILNEKACLTCHSLQGKGARISADLAALGALDSPLAMITAMWNHAPAMHKILQERKMKWQELSGRDMANLYAYLRSFSRSGKTEN